MKLFTALFDIALLPVAIVKDIVLFPITIAEDNESEIRKQVEKIDEALNDD